MQAGRYRHGAGYKGMPAAAGPASVSAAAVTVNYLSLPRVRAWKVAPFGRGTRRKSF